MAELQNPETSESLIASLIQPRLDRLTRLVIKMRENPGDATLGKTAKECAVDLKDLVANDPALSDLKEKVMEFPIELEGDYRITIDATNLHGKERADITEEDVDKVKIKVEAKPVDAAVSSTETIRKPEISNDAPPWLTEVVSVSGKYHSYLHRTDHDIADQILQNGFNGGADLNSTAHPLIDEPYSLKMLKGSHINTDNPAMAAVVMRVPEVIFQVAEKRKREFAQRPAEGGGFLSQAFNKPNTTVDEILRLEIGKGGVFIPSEWVYAVADQRDLQKPLKYNPRYGKPNPEVDSILQKFQEEIDSK